MELLGIQALGVLAVAVWTIATTFVLFKTIDATVGLRVDREEEESGLDLSEHGSEAYGDFALKSAESFINI